jgi:hypothetical protein
MSGVLARLAIGAVVVVPCAVLAQLPAEANGSQPVLRIDRCRIFQDARLDPSNALDCTGPAREACAGKPACELPIGTNLSGGNDQAFEALVQVDYDCGATEAQAGPHQFNNHATVTLACGLIL